MAARRRWRALGIVGLVALFVWPLPELAGRAVSARTLQHLLAGYALPPVLLLGLSLDAVHRLPRWLLLTWRAVARPVPAALALNVALVVVSTPRVVDAAQSSLWLATISDAGLLLVGLVAWTCVCGPAPAWRLHTGGQLLYLFTLSVVPAVPGAFLLFSTGVVYSSYLDAVHPLGWSVVGDQQAAGVLMKLGGTAFLLAVIAAIFFGRFVKGLDDGPVSPEPPLTFEAVERAFASTPPAPEPRR